ncbi:MAG TPA: NlpC/P60 family protein [Actinophytocola sp.]|uniref:NlpC/P60 family protein n=1 Tax=Actinophytocola sp. TaxID=1872138 RepID=UPI002DBC2C40|nr:NlpC/P60 family protein [Actinophytocola sp.]HEU5475227.1 NlpC/P60 family protein [Actinophytocola sp.]
MLTRRVRAAGVTAASVALLLTLAPVPAGAEAPPPPPNPSDAELRDSRADAKARAGQVGELTSRVADAEAKLIALQAEVELKLEEANKALVDLQAAEEAARVARADAEAARREADGAGRVVEQARRDVDAFVAGSFKQGSTIGSVSAYLGAQGVEDLLAKIQLLNSVSGSAIDAMAELDRARVDKANKDSAARAALDLANAKQAEAERAKRAADAATEAARAAQRDQVARAKELIAARDAAEQALAAAQARAGGLEHQRQRYLEWLAAKQREDAARARGGAAGLPAGGRVRVVIERALAQLGVTYAWGGGNANGPTRGMRDGGVADAFGDYQKIGFDCSGLMIYAFAGVGISLPHYSGYQAERGRRVPLDDMAPGDMLFWQTGGRIHHVALYLGNEQMVEAPYSGAHVRIASVRYGGIAPFAVRLL